MTALLLVVCSAAAVAAALKGEAVGAMLLGFAAGANFIECIRAMWSQDGRRRT